MHISENLCKENTGEVIDQNSIEDIQEKTSFYLTELFTYFSEENQEIPS
ncbi:MAG: hypothetical protein WC875_02585 [Candidatus Absconditabacterales bacterium]|jgi:hypothetical protein